jgi:DUF2075 family protein
MLIYSGTIKTFNDDVLNKTIADKIQNAFNKINFKHNNRSEYISWENSLKDMSLVLNDSSIDQDIKVAIEYNIPNTSKRIDFIVSGFDSDNNKNALIIELKQWEKAEKTNQDGVVKTFIGGSQRLTTHPAYQADSYGKMILNFNADIYENNINVKTCSYLHNFQEIYRSELQNDFYSEIINESPIFLKNDAKEFRDFIKKYVKKHDDGDILYKFENGKIKPSKSLQDALGNMLNGNNDFIMIDEQKVVYSTILEAVDKASNLNEKTTIIVEGGPGTGKSVVAINLMVALKGKLVSYVTKNAAPRKVYFEKLRKEKFKSNFINNLFKSSGAFINSKNNEYDCLIVDEAHRLNEKSGMYGNEGYNQIYEIIKASKVSVFFIDEDQIVTTRDYGTTRRIKEQANQLGSKVIEGQDYKLTSQFRCNGSDGYLAFLDNLLMIRETANYEVDLNYDFKVFDDLTEMNKELEIKNANNKARMLAGYCYEWKSKNKNTEDIYDIEINDFKAKWNFSNTSTWAIDEDSFDQVGCIHTSQGLEFDYVGVIIGKDLIYDKDEIKTNMSKRAKTDHSLKGTKSNGNFGLADKIIKNTYRTLMTRGQKGCYIYCEDKPLANYIKKIINQKHST